MRKKSLVRIWKSEPVIHSQKVVQVGRTAAPMPEHKYWRFDGHVREFWPETPGLVTMVEAVLDARESDRQCARKAVWIKSLDVTAEQFHPIAESNTTKQTGTKVGKERVPPGHSRSPVCLIR